MSSRSCAAAALIALVSAAMPSDARAAPLAECRVAGIANSVLCGAVVRPLDPERKAGAQISVRYVVVPAVARRKLPDPVFLLAGGPGRARLHLRRP